MNMSRDKVISNLTQEHQVTEPTERHYSLIQFGILPELLNRIYEAMELL